MIATNLIMISAESGEVAAEIAATQEGRHPLYVVETEGSKRAGKTERKYFAFFDVATYAAYKRKLSEPDNSVSLTAMIKDMGIDW